VTVDQYPKSARKLHYEALLHFYDEGISCYTADIKHGWAGWIVYTFVG